MVSGLLVMIFRSLLLNTFIFIIIDVFVGNLVSIAHITHLYTQHTKIFSIVTLI